MDKDPAFLFYSKDFYEGTRMLLPEERACLVDLMIYQHQNGPIPNDIRRLCMYCSGVSEATLQATLQAKFKLVDGFWQNDKLNKVISDRKENAKNAFENGTIGQLWKKAKSFLSAKDYQLFKNFLSGLSKKEILDKINEENEINKATLEAWLKQGLSIRVANAIEDAIEDSFLGKEGVGEKPFLKPDLKKVQDTRPIPAHESTPARKLNNSGSPISFERSIWFDFAVFCDECPPDWSDAKKKNYYDAAIAQSNKGGKYINWITAVKNWDGKNKFVEPITEKTVYPKGLYVPPPQVPRTFITGPYIPAETLKIKES